MSTTFIRKRDETDLDPEQINHLESWLKDSSYFSDYDPYKILRNEVLLRVYKYTPELPEGEDYLLDEHGVPYVSHKERILPFGKVIAVGSKCEDGHQVGDVVILPDAVGLRTYNEEYLRFVERNDERPIVKGEHPPVFNYGIDKWAHMIFVRDKVAGFDEDDHMCYIIPETLIKTGSNLGIS